VSWSRESIKGIVFASFKTGITTERSMNASLKIPIECLGQGEHAWYGWLSLGKERGGLVCSGLTLRIGLERSADVAVGSVDIVGQRLHGGDCCEGNQRKHQRILDEVLTLFVHQKGLHLDREHQQSIFHFGSSPVRRLSQQQLGMPFLSQSDSHFSLTCLSL
jgi:hypothetical protein